jgi:hypothetical protein
MMCVLWYDSFARNVGSTRDVASCCCTIRLITWVLSCVMDVGVHVVFVFVYVNVSTGSWSFRVQHRVDVSHLLMVRY